MIWVLIGFLILALVIGAVEALWWLVVIAAIALIFAGIAGTRR